MVICKFFLQGTCKFGDTCKFEHQLNDHNYGGNSSILLQNYAPKPQTTSNVDTNTLVKAVVNDMTAAEKGGQWLLSSYAPFKEKPAFPGFEDHSMEEIRFLFYEAMKTGTIDQYKQNLQMMLQQAMMKIKALQNPSPDAINMLKNIYDTPSTLNFTNNHKSSSFGGSQSQTVFGNTNSNQTVFRGSNSQQNAFGSNTSTNAMFGAKQASNSSVFGAQPPQNKSIFGNAASQQTKSNSIFGTSTSVFGGGAQQSVFGKSQQNSTFGQTNQSPFGQGISIQPQNQSPFGQHASSQQSQSPFGQSTSPQQQNQSPFGQIANSQQNQSPFGQVTSSQQNQSPFSQNITQTQLNNQPSFAQNAAQQQNQSPFGQNVTQQQIQSQFGQNATQQPGQSAFGANAAKQQNQSAFGPNGAQQQNQSPFGQNTAPQNIFQKNQFAATPFSTVNSQFVATQNASQVVSPQIGLSNPQSKPAIQHSQNIFGNVGLQTTSFGGSALQTKQDEEFYSKLEELNEEEIKWFQSDDLDIMKIPEKPPTYEMCFKVQ